jgi:hypothetical protein
MVKKSLKDIESYTGAQLFLLAGFEKTDGTMALAKYDSD